MKTITYIAMLCAVFLQSAGQSPAANRKQPALLRVKAHDLFVSTSVHLLKDMDREKARVGYRKVVKIDDTYAPAWFNLGVLAEAAGEWAEAKSDFDKYLNVSPGGSYAKRARREQSIIAQRTSQPTLTKDEQYDAAISRARALLSAKFYKESIGEAGRAQAINSARWEAYAVVSLSMAKQNKPAEASKFLMLAIDHAPAGKRDQIRAALSSVSSAEAQ